MKVLKRLASARLAAWLIAVLVLLCVVAFIVPQQSHAALSLYEQWSIKNPVLASIARWTGMDDVFASPLFVAVLVVLAVNLVACTALRIRLRARRRMRVPLRTPKGAILYETTASTDQIESSLRGRFRLWHVGGVRDAETQVMYFDRGHFAFLGSVVLHIGLLLLMVGGLVSGLTRFDGRLVLTEGETVIDAPESYRGQPTEPTVGDAYAPFSVRLDSLRFDYEDGYITQAHAMLTFADDSGSAALESIVNAPARWRGKSFLMVKGGHAVRLEVRDSSGAVLVPDSAFRLGSHTEYGYADTIELPDGRVLSVETVSDATSQKRAIEEPMRLGDPLVILGIRESEGGDPGRSVEIRPGSTSQVQDVSVAVSDVRLWNEFAVRADRGIPITYGSFAIILCGALVRFVYGKRRFAVLLTPVGAGSNLAVWSPEHLVAETVHTFLTEQYPDVTVVEA